MERHGWTQKDHDALSDLPPDIRALTLAQMARIRARRGRDGLRVAVVVALVAFLLALNFAFRAQAQMCQAMDEMIVCDDGRTFQRMGEGMIVDDDNHTWIVEEDRVYTDQAYSTPIIGLFNEDDPEEWWLEREE